jgi:hypothetical protein
MPPKSKDAAREAAFASIADHRDAITRVCRAIHADPELSLEEQRAVERLTTFLEEQGFSVERGIAGMPTAFVAIYEHHDKEFMRKGARHANVGFIAEYDALPDVGHAHGHPLTAAVALSAALAIQSTFDHSVWGTITVIGTPGTFVGVKNRISREGVFAPLDAVFGAHPASTGQGFLHTFDSSGNTVGSARVTVTYSGAGDASVAVERFLAGIERNPPQAREEESVSAIDGSRSESGVAFLVQAASRSRIVELLVDLKTQAALATHETELELDFSVDDIYDEMVVSRVLARRVKTYADNLGLKLDKPQKMPFGDPTEWGSVSYDTSAVQAFFSIDSDEPVTLGDADFARAADSDAAYEQAFRLAECISFAALDLYRELDFRAMTDNQLVKALAARGVERPHRRWTGLHPVLPKTDGESHARGPALLDFKIVKGPGTEAGDTSNSDPS